VAEAAAVFAVGDDGSCGGSRDEEDGGGEHS